MLSLKSFHLFFVSIAIVLLSGLGTWGLFNHHVRMGIAALIGGGLLVLYEGYFGRRSSRSG